MSDGTNRSGPVGSAARGRGSAPSVLVVDDERSFARCLALQFEAAGYAVHAAYDGDEALRALERELPDLVVLDVIMPVRDGIQVLREIHARYGKRMPSVILLTGDTSHRVDAAALVYGTTCLLAKPCTFQEVIEAAERMLAVTR